VRNEPAARHHPSDPRLRRSTVRISGSASTTARHPPGPHQNKIKNDSILRCYGFGLPFHRAFAAFFAISRRSAAVSDAARAAPPTNPPARASSRRCVLLSFAIAAVPAIEAISERCSGDNRIIRSFDSATAAAFLRGIGRSVSHGRRSSMDHRSGSAIMLDRLSKDGHTDNRAISRRIDSYEP